MTLSYSAQSKMFHYYLLKLMIMNLQIIIINCNYNTSFVINNGVTSPFTWISLYMRLNTF